MTRARRRFVLTLLAAAGAPLALARREQPTPTAGVEKRTAEVAHELASDRNSITQTEGNMQKHNAQARLAVAVAGIIFAAGIAFGIVIERTPTPGADPLTVYAAELHARGAGQGGTIGDLAEYLVRGE